MYNVNSIDMEYIRVYYYIYNIERKAVFRWQKQQQKEERTNIKEKFLIIDSGRRCVEEE